MNKNFKEPFESMEISPNLENDESLWEEIDEVLDETLIEADAPFLTLNEEDDAYREMQQTLVELMASSLNPVQRYMKALAQGEECREIFEISEMIITALIPKLEEAELKNHLEELVFFRSLLLLTLGENDQHAMSKLKEILLEAFVHVKTRFGLKYRGYRTAVRNLVEFYRAMKQHEDINEKDIRRFFSIGIPSLTWIRKTRSDELSSLSGISVKTINEMKKMAHVYHALPSPAVSLSKGLRNIPESEPNTPTFESLDEVIPTKTY